jgi:hypothetical protein
VRGHQAIGGGDRGGPRAGSSPRGKLTAVLTSGVAFEGMEVRGEEANIRGAVSAGCSAAVQDDGAAREDPFLNFAGG